ncbi:MAG: DUF3501 family protein [Betaproteobacteria bacterium]|nr:DUF3501 family protein [Betaproteobacteria bacterium]MBL8534269.1 DUF3501 family protein [Betaproteobacteria bacterium]
MNAIPRDSLMTLESYARNRKDFRAKVMEHKKSRQVRIGDHVTLIFEDELTLRYQIQEMLRIEKIFDEAGIQGELEAYTPLLPDGSNWKATMLIEYPEVDERRVRLAELKGIEDLTWVRVAGHAKVFAIADEDLERENDEKTSSVHFLRFELSSAMKTSLRGGASLSIGIDHASYTHANDPVSSGIRDSLLNDLRFPT